MIESKEAKEDLRDAIIGRLTLQLESERKVVDDLVMEQYALRQTLEKLVASLPLYQPFGRRHRD